jgi:hypothetical protein
MKPIPINIAVEDLLSEAVAKRLLADSGRNFSIGVVFNRGGNGYLRKTVQGWNNAAKSVPFFLLTDLDADACASALMASWLPDSVHPNLIFRVAVREVESWLLADRISFSSFLGVSGSRLPERPDELSDPKSTLVELVSKSRHNLVKARIVPRPNSTAKQGRDYNGCLCEFVMKKWTPDQAALNSPSLDRCRRRLAEFLPTWSE